MDYFVLACKGDQKTYELVDSLEKAFIEADELNNAGWEIDGILKTDIQKEYQEDYINLSHLLKSLCDGIKTKIGESGQIMDADLIADCKERIMEVLSSECTDISELKTYVDSKINEYLGWDVTAVLLSNHIESKLSQCYIKK